MRRRSIVPVLTIVVLLTASLSGLAGSSSSPEIQDDSGDAQVQGSSTPATTPLQDWVDIDPGAWYVSDGPTNLTVGIGLADLPSEQQLQEDPITLTYTITFTFHRPSDRNISQDWGVLKEDETVTISAGASENSFSCGGLASGSPMRDGTTLTCDVPSSAMAPTEFGNGSFYAGDMIMNGTAESSGEYPAGSGTTANDTAPDSGEGEIYFIDDTLSKPSGDNGGGGGGGGDNGGGGGGNGDGGGGDSPDESTPGFEGLAALAALSAVAVWARRRR